MSNRVSGTQAYTGNDLGGFATVGQIAGAATNPAPWHLINGAADNQGNDAYARTPYGGYFQGLSIYVGFNDHDGDNEVSFFKITESSNYLTKVKISALTITIPAGMTGYFWSNPDVDRGLRFFRSNDNIGIEVFKVDGGQFTGIDDVTVSAIYDFEDQGI